MAMIMKAYDGSLSKLIADTDIVVLPILDLAMQLNAAMIEMHKSGITHCDLKPDNILFCKTKDKARPYTVHVTDFGISQVRLAAEKVKTRRNIRVPAASITYASPEILTRFMGPGDLDMQLVVQVTLNSTKEQKKVPADEASPSRDIYAFAVILYETVSRDFCWKKMSSMEVYSAVAMRGDRPEMPPYGSSLQNVLKR